MERKWSSQSELHVGDPDAQYKDEGEAESFMEIYRVTKGVEQITLAKVGNYSNPKHSCGVGTHIECGAVVDIILIIAGHSY